MAPLFYNDEKWYHACLFISGNHTKSMLIEKGPLTNFMQRHGVCGIETNSSIWREDWGSEDMLMKALDHLRQRENVCEEGIELFVRLMVCATGLEYEESGIGVETGVGDKRFMPYPLVLELYSASRENCGRICVDNSFFPCLVDTEDHTDSLGGNANLVRAIRSISPEEARYICDHLPRGSLPLEACYYSLADAVKAVRT